MSENIQYAYALNEQGEVVSINRINQTNRNQYFKCLSCNNELIPRLGTEKAHHFAHKISIHCSGETYLHRLAKIIFEHVYRDCLTYNRPFYLDYPEFESCGHFFKQYKLTCGKKESMGSINLIQYFPEIEVEVADGNFVPDILLSNPKGEKIYVEFAVSHSCSLDKMESGIRIIELSIMSEEDVLGLYNRHISRNTTAIKFYNFKKKTHYIDLCGGDCAEEFPAFYVYGSGKSYFTKDTIPAYIKKKSSVSRIYSILDTSFDQQDTVDYDYSFCKDYRNRVIEAYKKNVAIRNCFLCKKQTNINHLRPNPKLIWCRTKNHVVNSNEAVDCSEYTIDKDLLTF